MPGFSVRWGHHVVGLELVVVHGVRAAPQVQAEGAENGFAPALDDGLAVGLKARGPVPQRQGVLMRFIYHFFHLEAVHEKFLQQVGQAQVRVGAGVDVAPHEIAHFVFFKRGRGVEINAAPGLEALPHLRDKIAVVGDVLDDAEDDDGVVRFGRLVREEVFEANLAGRQPLVGDEVLVQPVRVLGNGSGAVQWMWRGPA